jgi:hypothetical protein
LREPGPAAEQALGLGGHILGPIVDHLVGTKRFDQSYIRARGRRNHPQSSELCKLHRESPTPPDAPWISTVWPGLTFAASNNTVHAVPAAIGNPAAWASGMRSGARRSRARCLFAI